MLPSPELRVLLVEDELDIREVLAEELEAFGFLADVAGNGVQALHHLHNGSGLPDVIVSNLNMPEMDGLEFLHEVRGDAALPDIPVVLITAGITPDRSLTDADAVLHKPFETEELVDTIHRVHRRRMVREAPDQMDQFEVASHT